MFHFGLGLVLSVFLFAAPANAAVEGDEWRYQDIVKLIEARKAEGRPFQSPDELIAAFPEGMKRYFTFVFESGNKFQDADPQNPRALVFNHNLIYAFNGHAKQRGNNVIELMELDQEKRSLELREIEFAKGAEGAEVHYSTSNPAKCLQCHGSNPRPIWFAYSTWPGVYGSNDDRMDQTQKANYQKFLQTVRDNPETSRYAKLKFPTGSDLTPYISTKGSGAFDFRLNLVFTKLLSRFNAIRLVGLAQQSPYWKNFKWILPQSGYSYGQCAMGANVQELNARLDALIAKRHLRVAKSAGPFDKLMAVLDIPVSRFNMAPDGRNYYYGDGSGDQVGLFRDALMLALAEEGSALKEKLQLNKQRHKERYKAYDLYEYEDSLVPSVYIKDCSRLTELAVKELESEIAEPPSTGKTFEELLSTAESVRVNTAVPIGCVYCHTVAPEGNTPKIAFDNEAELAKELNVDNGRLRERLFERANPTAKANLVMPPPGSDLFMKLSDKEFEEFKTYIRSVK